MCALKRLRSFIIVSLYISGSFYRGGTQRKFDRSENKTVFQPYSNLYAYSRTSTANARESNRREAPRAAEHGQTHRARLDGQTSEAETVDTGDERVAVGQGSRPRGRRGRERVCVCVCIATRAEPRKSHSVVERTRDEARASE